MDNEGKKFDTDKTRYDLIPAGSLDTLAQAYAIVLCFTLLDYQKIKSELDDRVKQQ